MLNLWNFLYFLSLLSEHQLLPACQHRWPSGHVTPLILMWLCCAVCCSRTGRRRACTGPWCTTCSASGRSWRRGLNVPQSPWLHLCHGHAAAPWWLRHPHWSTPTRLRSLIETALIVASKPSLGCPCCSCWFVTFAFSYFSQDMSLKCNEEGKSLSTETFARVSLTNLRRQAVPDLSSDLGMNIFKKVRDWPLCFKLKQ